MQRWTSAPTFTFSATILQAQTSASGKVDVLEQLLSAGGAASSFLNQMTPAEKQITLLTFTRWRVRAAFIFNANCFLTPPEKGVMELKVEQWRFIGAARWLPTFLKVVVSGTIQQQQQPGEERRRYR